VHLIPQEERDEENGGIEKSETINKQNMGQLLFKISYSKRYGMTL
jgi:hypothetical protein